MKIVKWGMVGLACLSLNAFADFKPEIERTNDTLGERGVSAALNNRSFVGAAYVNLQGETDETTGTAVDNYELDGDALGINGGARINDLFAFEAGFINTNFDYKQTNTPASPDSETKSSSFIGNAGFTITPAIQLGAGFTIGKIKTSSIGNDSKYDDSDFHVDAAFAFMPNFYAVAGLKNNMYEDKTDDLKLSYMTYSVGVVYSDIKNRQTDAISAELIVSMTEDDEDENTTPTGKSSIDTDKSTNITAGISKVYQEFEFGGEFTLVDEDKAADSHNLQIYTEYLLPVGIFFKPHVTFHKVSGVAEGEELALTVGYRTQGFNVMVGYSIDNTDTDADANFGTKVEDKNKTLLVSASYLF